MRGQEEVVFQLVGWGLGALVDVSAARGVGRGAGEEGTDYLFENGL